MANLFKNLPKNATLSPSPFTVDIPQQALDELQILLKYAKVPADTYESVQEDFRFGLTTAWIIDAKEKWQKEFDWRKHESYINTFPQYIADIVDDDGKTHNIHYVALYSDKVDAIPLTFLHGWPGSFLEFLPILEILRTRYTPATLPYHIIVPSLPGYAFSSAPPLDKDFQLEDVARVLDKLMVGLGFGSGYVAQGGDIGSRITRILASTYPSCKAAHLNFSSMNKPDNVDDSTLTDAEKAGIARGVEFKTTGAAYAIMHATRPSTIGIILASNPLALLAWIGEKFLAWTDETPSLDAILESITLYWLTQSFPSAIYPYRQSFASKAVGTHNNGLYKIHKPFGFSAFPKELVPVPPSWIETTGNLVFFREHTKGGHFAAMEQPEILLSDVEEFIAQVWSGAKA